MDVKAFRITAKYYLQRREFTFRKDIRALSREKALEKFYSIIGAQKVKKNQVRIIEIKEISPMEIKPRTLRKIAILDNPALYVE